MENRKARFRTVIALILDGKEYLFPSIKECILDVNLEEGKVTVHILDGLLDL